MCPFFLPPSFGSCYELCSAWNSLLPPIDQNISCVPAPCYLFHEIFSGSSHLRSLLPNSPHGICFGQDSVGCKWESQLKVASAKQGIYWLKTLKTSAIAWSVWTTSSGLSQSLFWVGCILRWALYQVVANVTFPNPTFLPTKRELLFLDNKYSQIASHQPSLSHMSTTHHHGNGGE